MPLKGLIRKDWLKKKFSMKKRLLKRLREKERRKLRLIGRLLRSFC